MVRLPPCHVAFLASLLLVSLSEVRGDCGHPAVFPNAELKQEPQESYSVGTKLTYYCRPGYEITSGPRPVTECLGTSQWSVISVPCQRRRCRVPRIENGKLAAPSDLLYGDAITFVCDEGFRIVGHNGARCVVQNKNVVWDNEPPHCERIPCHPPPYIANGSHNGMDNYVYGSVVTYRCEKGYSLIGSNTILCRSDEAQNGVWSASAPECKVVSCRTLDIPNGVMVTSYRPSYTYGDRILFECKSGFKLKGNRGDSSCEADSRWQPLPECILDIRSTASTGGGGEDDTSAGSTVQSPIGSTVKPTEETTKTEIGHTETPELPTDEPGSSISVPVAVGAAVAVIAVVAIFVAALVYRAHHKRQGKTITGSASESYTAVPHNTDISLTEKV